MVWGTAMMTDLKHQPDDDDGHGDAVEPLPPLPALGLAGGGQDTIPGTLSRIPPYG